jgi:hypothetical protein
LRILVEVLSHHQGDADPRLRSTTLHRLAIGVKGWKGQVIVTVDEHEAILTGEMPFLQLAWNLVCGSGYNEKMRRRLLFVVVAVLGFPGLVEAGPLPLLPQRLARTPTGDPLEPEHVEALKSGEMLTALRSVGEGHLKQAVVVAMVEAPPRRVFEEITDYESPDIQEIPYARKVEVQKREGKRTWVSYDLDFPWPLKDPFYTVVITDRVVQEEGFEVFVSEWEYEDGSGNIKDTYGSWQIAAVGEGSSLVRYTVYADAGIKLPKWVLDLAQKRAAPGVLKGLRRRVADSPSSP